MERVRERIALARKALATFEELAKLTAPSMIERDAAIQRFEYSFEAVWKATQRYLKDMEGIDATSPKAVIRAALRAALLRSCFKNYCACHNCVARWLEILMYSHVHSGSSPACALFCRRSRHF